MNISHKRGFTLIELLVVIAIIGVLAGVVLTSLGTARAKARDAQKISNLKNVQLALEMYADVSNGVYPAANDTVTAAVCYGLNGLVTTYMPTLPSSTDSAQCDYYYSTTNSGKNYHIATKLEQDNAVLKTDNDGTDAVVSGMVQIFGGSDTCTATLISGASERCYDITN